MTEFYNANAFDLNLMTSHLDEVDRDEKERMRMMIWASLAPYSKKNVTPEDIIIFDWEKHETTKPSTREDFENAIKKFTKKQ